MCVNLLYVAAIFIIHNESDHCSPSYHSHFAAWQRGAFGVCVKIAFPTLWLSALHTLQATNIPTRIYIFTDQNNFYLFWLVCLHILLFWFFVFVSLWSDFVVTNGSFHHYSLNNKYTARFSQKWHSQWKITLLHKHTHTHTSPTTEKYIMLMINFNCYCLAFNMRITWNRWNF